jgi:hypothetical protein
MMDLPAIAGLGAHVKWSIYMASRIQLMQTMRVLSALMLALLLACTSTVPAYAGDFVVSVPDLAGFIESVSDGNADVLRGVYVPEVMAISVIQQPAGSPGFVSQAANRLTQFNMAAEAGNVGLLAHNYLSGRVFALLAPGNNVILVYGDGHIEGFLVTRILQFQALDPENPFSGFRKLDSRTTVTAEELFNQVYRGERHVTFQTCIEANGDLSWGRLFVIAEPIASNGISFTDTRMEGAFKE